MDRALVFEVWCNPEEEGLVASNDDLHIAATGSNPAELLANIGDNLRWFWQEYVEADPNKLSADAVEFGKRLKDLLENGGTIRLERAE